MEVVNTSGIWYISDSNGINILRNQIFNSQKDADEMVDRINKQKEKKE